MAVCGAAMWMLIGAFMKPYARTAAEIVAALNTGGPSGRGIQPSYGVDGKLLYQHASGIFPALCPALADPWGGLPGRGRISAGFGDRVSVAHIPSLVMGPGLFTLGVAPAVMGLVLLLKDFPDLERAAENRINDRAHWLAYMREWAAGLI